LLLKIGIPESLIKLAYRFVDVEKYSLTLDERTLEYSFAISKLCKLTPGNLLDIGCSARVNLIPSTFCELGWKVWGIDLRDYNFRHNNFTFIKDSILSYPFPTESFDAITAVSTIEHIGVKGRYGIKERVTWADKSTFNMVRRLLKPSGKFILTVPYGDVYKETPLNKVYDMENLLWLCRNWNIKELRTTETLALVELVK